jgi:lipid-binding SYLF domain-containing protein
MGTARGNHRLVWTISGFLLFSLVAGCSSTGTQSTVQQDKIQSLNDHEQETLQRLYQQSPETEQAIQAAPGYAVFHIVVTKVPVIGAGGGDGVVVDNKTGDRTYMKVRRFDVGGGWGVREFDAVIIFKKDIIADVIGGTWHFGAGVEAAAKVGETGAGGGSSGSHEDFEVYQLSGSGVSATVTVRIIRIKPIKELNEL